MGWDYYCDWMNIRQLPASGACDSQGSHDFLTPGFELLHPVHIVNFASISGLNLNNILHREAS